MARLLWPWLAVRVAVALYVQTYFVPDEYWQGPEVAHRAVFGCGHLTWEWRGEAPIRSFTFPALYAAAFAVLRALGLDIAWMLWAAPRAMHGCMMAAQDFAVYKLCRHLFTAQQADAALWLHATSWFVAYCSSRTLSSSVEAAACTLALAYWYGTRRRVAAVWMAVAIAVRPTCLVMWLPFVAATSIMHVRLGAWRAAASTVALAATSAAAALLVTVAVDTWFYGHLVVTPWNFLAFNVLHGHDALYGAHPFHYYVTEALPVVATTILPVAIAGVYTSAHRTLPLVAFVASSIVAHSVANHKEYRFILPLLPPLCCFAAAGLDAIQQWLRARMRRAVAENCKKAFWSITIGLNCALLYYFGRWHQAAPLAVMRQVSLLATAPGTSMSVHAWTPCHATPWTSVVHECVDMRFFDCSPAAAMSSHGDESTFFRAHPLVMLSQRYRAPNEPSAPIPRNIQHAPWWTTRWSLPTHAVVFDNALPAIQPFLQAHNYRIVRCRGCHEAACHS